MSPTNAPLSHFAPQYPSMLSEEINDVVDTFILLRDRRLVWILNCFARVTKLGYVDVSRTDSLFHSLNFEAEYHISCENGLAESITYFQIEEIVQRFQEIRQG